MDKILVYGEAEAIHDHCNKQKRHAKIEIVIQSSARPNRQGSRAGLTHGLLLSCDHRNCTQYYHGNIVLSEMRRFASGTRQSAQSGNLATSVTDSIGTICPVRTSPICSLTRTHCALRLIGLLRDLNHHID
jgi:hypothetical protein